MGALLGAASGGGLANSATQGGATNGGTTGGADGSGGGGGGGQGMQTGGGGANGLLGILSMLSQGAQQGMNQQQGGGGGGILSMLLNGGGQGGANGGLNIPNQAGGQMVQTPTFMPSNFGPMPTVGGPQQMMSGNPNAQQSSNGVAYDGNGQYGGPPQAQGAQGDVGGLLSSLNPGNYTAQSQTFNPWAVGNGTSASS